jgi:hypothetical protein
MGGIYEVCCEDGLGAMIYIPNFMKVGSAIQKLMEGIQSQHGDRISLLLFFQNKESRKKIKVRGMLCTENSCM